MRHLPAGITYRNPAALKPVYPWRRWAVADHQSLPERVIMPTREERIPDTIKRSPAKVRRAYTETLDSAHEQYGSEERAHRAAWASVKHIAEKIGDHWELKPHPGPSDDQDAQSGPVARARPKPTAGGVDSARAHQAGALPAGQAGRHPRTLPHEQAGAGAGDRAEERLAARYHRARDEYRARSDLAVPGSVRDHLHGPATAAGVASLLQGQADLPGRADAHRVDLMVDKTASAPTTLGLDRRLTPRPRLKASTVCSTCFFGSRATDGSARWR